MAGGRRTYGCAAAFFAAAGVICLYIGGRRLEIHAGFAAAAAFLLLADRSGVWIAGAAAAVWHECGHLLCMEILGVPAVCLKCGLFGLEIQEERRCREGYRKDILISLAGPAANLLACLVLLPTWRLLPGEFGLRLLAANAALGIFHLLPVGPLDGGQAVYAALSRQVSIGWAERIVTAISFLTLLPMSILGFLVLLRSRYNFTLLLLSGYLMLLLMMKKGRYY